jgi:hypothetical protein
MTADDFRDIALGMPGAIERAHMGHPDFRAGVRGRIFASLDAREEWATVKLSPEEQREFLRSHPTTFVPAAGAWGRQGWTRVLLRTADAATVRPAVLLAWEKMVSG